MTGQFCDVIKVAMIHKEDLVKFVNKAKYENKKLKPLTYIFG
jgi:hypothetical protein